jgi:ABC-type transport system involved in cytochrome c biogenesis permease subunit
MQERDLKLMSGWPALLAWALWLGLIVLLVVVALLAHLPWLGLVCLALLLAWLWMPFGFIVNSPNQSRVVQLFGEYIGVVRDTGFFYGNPF